MKTILVLLFTLLWLSHSRAQSVYNQGAQIEVGAQTIFTVGESLFNNGTIKNDGDIRISGGWTNNGTYEPGLGQITFNSSQSQIINHNDQAFKRLTINGGGEKVFLANITVESELVLINGNLVSQNGAKIILNEGAVISGGSDQTHIIGAVEHKGKGNWLFPVGNATTYLPVEIPDVTNSAATATLILHDLSHETLTGDNELIRLSSQRYWELIFSAGSLNENKIKLPLRGEEDLTSNTDLVVVTQSEKALGPFSSLGQSDVTGNLSSGTVTSARALNKSFYTVAALRDDKSIFVYNGMSPNRDKLNEYFRIGNIELYPNNQVTIYNRWGDIVFKISGYDNNQNVFRGENNLAGNATLSTGIYFYSIDLQDGSPKKTGYLQMK